jgi:hypothetical protein
MPIAPKGEETMAQKFFRLFLRARIVDQAPWFFACLALLALQQGID